MRNPSSTLVIAEAGVNHNGDISMALRLVDAAAEAGADYVKFQTFSAEALVTRDARKAAYQMEAGTAQESQFDMLKRLELAPEDYPRLRARCAERGIGFLSTGFDPGSVAFLGTLDLDLIKVPSGELTNLVYLRQVARLGRPLVLSTGMATLKEVEDALTVLETEGIPRSQVTVLHCTTEYPAPIDDVNLRAMLTIRDRCRVAVGYSDHTAGIEIAIAAAALGAVIIEKHFTLDSTLPGPDHRASLEPEALCALVQAIRNVERALGDGVKTPRPSELRNLPVARKSIVAARPIHAGDVFTADNLTVKRPGTGISPMLWDRVIGITADRDFAQDELIVTSRPL